MKLSKKNIHVWTTLKGRFFRYLKVVTSNLTSQIDCKTDCVYIRVIEAYSATNERHCKRRYLYYYNYLLLYSVLKSE